MNKMSLIPYFNLSYGIRALSTPIKFLNLPCPDFLSLTLQTHLIQICQLLCPMFQLLLSASQLVSFPSINVNAQLPLKCTVHNYSSWHAQFYALLFCYNLLGYVDDSLLCLPIFEASAHSFKLCQDQLIFHAIFASLSKSIMPLIASTKTSQSMVKIDQTLCWLILKSYPSSQRKNFLNHP